MANNPYIIKQMWAKGSQTVEFFETGGTEITDSNFKVDEVGTYTVFTSLTNGDKYVTELEILQEDLFIPVPTTSTVDGIVTITYPEGISPTLQKWDYGIKTIEELESNGFVVSGDAFEVSVAGEVSILYVLEGYYKFLHTFIVDESEVPVSNHPTILFADNEATIVIPEGRTAVELEYTYGTVNSPEEFKNLSFGVYKVYKNNKIFMDKMYKGTAKHATVYYKYDDNTDGVKTFAFEDVEGEYLPKTNQTYVNFANGEILTAGNGSYMLLDKEAGLAVELYRFTEERFNTSYNVKVYAPQSSASIGYKENVTDFNALPQLQKDKFIQKTFQNENEIGNLTGGFSARYRLISYHEIDKWIDKIMPAMALQKVGFGSEERWRRLWTRTQVSDEMAVWGINENGEPIKISMVYDANKSSRDYEAIGVNLVHLDVNNMYNGYQSNIDYPYFEPTVTAWQGTVTVRFDGKIRYQRIGYRDGQRTLEEMESINWELDQGGTFEITQAGWYTIFTRMLDGTGHIKQVYFDESTLKSYRADFWGTAGRVKFKFNKTVPPFMDGSRVRWMYGERTTAYFNKGSGGYAPVFPTLERDAMYMDLLKTQEHKITVYVWNGLQEEVVEVYDIPDLYYELPTNTVEYDSEGLVTIQGIPSEREHILNKRWIDSFQNVSYFSGRPSNGYPTPDSFQMQVQKSGQYTFYYYYDNYYETVVNKEITITPTIFITDCVTGDHVQYAGKDFIYLYENKIMFVESQGFKAFDIGGGNTFDPSRTQNIAHWLNGDFYNSLSQDIKNEMIGSSWDISYAYNNSDIVNCNVGLIERRFLNTGSAWSSGNTAFKDATTALLSSTSGYYFWAINKGGNSKSGSRRQATSTSWGTTILSDNVYNTHPVIRLSDSAKVKLMKRYMS